MCCYIDSSNPQDDIVMIGDRSSNFEQHLGEVPYAHKFCELSRSGEIQVLQKLIG